MRYWWVMQVNIIRATAPDASEHSLHFGRYTALVPNGDIVQTLEKQCPETVALLAGLSDAQGDYRYAPGKWSIKEMLGHLNDTERIMSYRALRIARGDATPLPGFEQDDYVRGANFAGYRIASLLEEFTCVRHATVLLFQQLNAEAWLRRGVASQADVSARALAYVIAGHEIHHRNVLREKYLSGAAADRA